MSRIGSVLGVPISEDDCTTRQVRIYYTRISVEVDITGALPSEVMEEDPFGKMLAQKVKYEWLPKFFHKCVKLGHQCYDKGHKKEAQLQWV